MVTLVSRLRVVFLLVAVAALVTPARSFGQQPAQSLAIPLGGGGQLAMMLIHGGTFTQGSPATEKGRGADETQREVTISSPFYVSRYPITRGQFALFAQQSGYATEAEKGASGGSGWDGHALVQRRDFTWKSPGFTQSDTDPVTLVTYADAQAFAEWATAKAGRKVQLPTEAQWEYAARAGTTTPFFGAPDDAHALDLGWYKPNAGNGTRPVGRKMPNAWNLHEMGGDVYEWCRDWYGPYAAGPVTDPEVAVAPPGDTPRRVLRGGSWLKPAVSGRSAARYRNTPGSRNADNGFRLIMDVDGPPVAAAPTTSPGPVAPVPPPVAPLSQPAPSESDPEGDSTVSSVISFAAILGGLGVVGGLVAYVLRRRRSPRRLLDPASAITRIAPDGFWVSAPAPAGSRVRYQAVVDGVPVDQHVTLDGSEQGTFVHTGSRPDQVRVLAITAVAAAAAEGAMPASERRPEAPGSDDTGSGGEGTT